MAKNEHSVHAPFLFGLYTTVISVKSDLKEFEEIERLRNALKNATEIIFFEELGAKKTNRSSQPVKVSEVAKKSLSSIKKATLQVRLIRHFQPKMIIEVGTSLGINTCYLQKAAPGAQIISFEGVAAIAEIAKNNFKLLKYNMIELVVGNFNDTFHARLKVLKEPVDYIFFDGNHTYEATIDYYKTARKYSHDSSIFVFDDIHWSAEMNRAWQEIKSFDEVKITVDLHQVGIVFFKKTLSKQNFILRF